MCGEVWSISILRVTLNKGLTGKKKVKRFQSYYWLNNTFKVYQLLVPEEQNMLLQPHRGCRAWSGLARNSTNITPKQALAFLDHQFHGVISISPFCKQLKSADGRRNVIYSTCLLAQFLCTHL